MGWRVALFHIDDYINNHLFPSVDPIRFNSIDENSTNSNEIMKILVGTKRKKSKREVSLEKAESLADHLGVSYKEICFENQKNIRELFETLAGLTVLLYKENDFHSEIQMILPHDPKKKTSFCECGWLPSCLSVCLSPIHTHKGCCLSCVISLNAAVHIMDLNCTLHSDNVQYYIK